MRFVSGNFHSGGSRKSLGGVVICLFAVLSVTVGSPGAFAALGFGAVATLNTNADSDSGGDYGPRVSTNGSGNWVAVWYSGENLGGTAGADGDIFVSTTNAVPVTLSGYKID